MQKFLVIGCGGSGAKTQAYMMDQLKAYLRRVDPGREELPAALQFVSIDVPRTPEPGPDGLGNVADQGGSYVAMGSTQRYSEFDRGLSDRLGQEGALGDIATWASRAPQYEDKPISDGAGQYRGIGRILTIQNLPKIRAALAEALERLEHADTNEELNLLNARITPGRTDDQTDATPMVLVVSSMAGGAGASMFLDVCRLLTTMPKVDPANIALFLLTPEAFSDIKAAEKGGMWPNALAVFGEVIAAQSGAAGDHDARLYRAMGLSTPPAEFPFGRLFPIGGRMGSQGAVFGDGTALDVYRGLARALSALVASESASQDFRSFRMGNTGSPEGDRSVLGWGDPNRVKWNRLPWGSLGYAQLSMGRDRFAEYSAQRLAHASFERLLSGHMKEGDRTTSSEQLQRLYDERLAGFLSGCYLPDLRGFDGDGWLSAVFGNSIAEASARARAMLLQLLPDGEGRKSREWKDQIRLRLRDNRGEVALLLQDEAYRSAHLFADVFADAFTGQVEEEIARYGLPLARKLVDATLDAVQGRWRPVLERIGERAATLDPMVETRDVTAQYQMLDVNAAVSNSSVFADRILDGLDAPMRDYVTACLAKLLAAVLDDFAVNALYPLSRLLETAHVNLDAAGRPGTGLRDLADVATEQPTAWPTERDETVDARFEGPDNEIMITDVADFPRDYAGHLLDTMGKQNLADATREAVTEILRGSWATTGARTAPEDTLAPRATGRRPGNRLGWVAQLLQAAPDGGDRREANQARFAPRLRPEDLMDRTRAWILRPGEPFERFIGVDLRTYLSPTAADNDAVHRDRLQRLAEAFRKALKQARPLAAVNGDMLSTVYGTAQEEYQYIFSEIPFLGTVDPLRRLTEVLEQEKSADPSSSRRFTKALTDEDTVTAIEVFGSYPNYSPVVFSSLLPHIAQDWASRRGNASYFWELRRARPLPAALPLSDAERQAMVGGWLLGRLTGRIRVLDPDTVSEAVEIWDDAASEWVAFPADLLTPPARQEGEGGVDRMPAILESVLLAYANCQQPGTGRAVASLRPYHLLRAIYDDHPQGPTTGRLRRSRVALLAEWLAGGDTPEGPTVLGATLQERADAAREEFGFQRELASWFLPGGPRPDLVEVRDRATACAMPLFRDIAADVDLVAADLLSRLPEAEEIARTGGGRHSGGDAGAGPGTGRGGVGLGDLLKGRHL